MTRKRRASGAAFKAKVALAAAKGDQTTAQLAVEFSVHTSQLTAWKKQPLEQAAGLFEDGRQRRDETAANEQELYEQIDRLLADALDSPSGEEGLHTDLLLVLDLFPFRPPEAIKSVCPDRVVGQRQRRAGKQANHESKG